MGAGSLNPCGTFELVPTAMPLSLSPVSFTNVPTRAVLVESWPVRGSRARRLAFGQVVGAVIATVQAGRKSTGALAGSKLDASKFEASSRRCAHCEFQPMRAP